MEIENIGIIGAGQMGLGIAHVFSLSGYKIFLNDINQDALDSSKSKINKSMDRQIRKNLISIDEKEKGLNNIKTHNEIRALIFPPFQLPIYNGKKIIKSIYKKKKIQLRYL